MQRITNVGGRVFEILNPGPLFFLDFIIFRLGFLFLKPGPFSKNYSLLIFYLFWIWKTWSICKNFCDKITLIRSKIITHFFTRKIILRVNLWFFYLQKWIAQTNIFELSSYKFSLKIFLIIPNINLHILG